MGATWPDSPEAEEAYVEYLDRRSAGEPVEFEAFCAERPELAPALRDIHALSSHLEKELLPHDVPDDPRFEVRRELGRGGMGVVYEVFDNDLGRALAMKVVRAGSGTTSEQRSALRRLSRFVEEAEITGRLSHPGIVPIHERGVDAEGRVFFTMPLVEGQGFDEILDELQRPDAAWTLAGALEVIRKVCDTMAFAHDRGVVHRDLKPSNVRVGRFGEVYVMDWGLARALDRADERDLRLDESGGDDGALLTMEGDVVGTPAYMSPEQAFGELERLSPQSDVYSVGALLYHLLAGRAPYADGGGTPTARATLERLRAGPPEPLADAPPELIAVCERSMARRPESRYAGMQAMARDLSAYVEGRVVAAYESGGWAELKKWIGRNRRFAVALAAAVLIAFVGLVLLLWQQAERNREERLAADRFRLESFLEELDELWPLTPEQVPRLEAWLRDARELASREGAHRARLARLEGTESAEDARRSLAEFRVSLDRLVAEGGAIAEIAERLEFARSVRARTVDAHAGAWRAAAEHYRERYPSDSPPLNPQVGLIPLGADVASGLLEFAHLQSGAPATRGSDGALAIGPETGLVLVLIPGGTARIGAEPPHGDAQDGRDHADARADGREGPVHEVALAPYFLSKFEMTGAQWHRIAGGEPPTSPRAPVGAVSWEEATRQARRLALELPTEAQWEHAARAGTDSPWWWGPDPSRIREFVRVDAGEGPLAVGSLPANPFGLHDVLGNVSEWCRDVYGVYGDVRGHADPALLDANGRWPIRPGSGERLVDGVQRVYRGGHFNLADLPVAGGDFTVRLTRASFRFDAFPTEAREYHGLRPSRALDLSRESVKSSLR